MEALSKVLRRNGNSLTFRCPGCHTNHSIPVGAAPGAWGWNGNPDAPTFTPSVLVTSGHYVAGHDPRGCWCTYNAAHPEEADPDFQCGRCHSYVTDGQIRFLSDCSHELAGRTVPLPEFEPEKDPA